MSITEIKITTASPEDQATGLIGYVSCLYGELVLDGIAIRKTLDGKTIVTFPGKARNGCGRRYFVSPRTTPVKKEFERVILEAFRRSNA